MIEGGGAFQEGSEMTAGPAVRHILEAYYGVEQSRKDPHPTVTLPTGVKSEKSNPGKPTKEEPRAAASQKSPRRGAAR